MLLTAVVLLLLAAVMVVYGVIHLLASGWRRVWPHRRSIVRVLLTVIGFLLLAAVAVVYGLALWKMPDLMNLTDPKDRYNARLLVVSIGGASVVAIGLLYTVRSYRLTRRGQVTDRFVKALERLGSEHLYVRYGGVLALEQIVQDAPDQATHAAQVLGTFIRDRTPRVPRHEPTPSVPTKRPITLWRRLTESMRPAASERPKQPPEDVQAALTALTRPASRRHVDRDQVIILEELHLAGAQLDGADLSGARLYRADLTGAQLNGADLISAQLGGAKLISAQLGGAKLISAQLGGAKLIEAQLGEADLTDARLHNADLTKARLYRADLTDAQLGRANLTDSDLNGVVGLE